MMLLSVLVLAISAQLAISRSRTNSNDLDNEVSIDPFGNMEPAAEQLEWVKISQPPEIVINKKYGAHVELHCEAMGSPAPTIQWYKGNMRITENDSFETNLIQQSNGLARVSSRLVINFLLPRHQDFYRCTAQSGGKTVSATTRLIILNKEGREMNFTQLIASKILGAHHKPRITFWAPIYMDVIGSTVVLPCKTVGNPKPFRTWYGPNENVIESDDRMTISPEGELRISSITWDDMGTYNCVVKNSVGRDQVETFLYPMQQPSK